MSASWAQLQLQRTQLVQRIAQQRAALASDLLPVQDLLTRADGAAAKVRNGVQFVKTHPLPVGLAVLAMALLRRRLGWPMVARGLVLWRGWRAMQVAGLPQSLWASLKYRLRR